MIEEFGNYASSYFIMNVPTEADLNIREMGERDFAVFFHEYVHFLQDITSFYGYMGIYSHGEYMRRAINDLYAMPKKVTMPLDIQDKGDFVLLNKKIAKFSLGDTDDRNFIAIGNPDKDIFIKQWELSDDFSIPELHVKSITNSGIEEIIVGAYAIRENMAYLLERKCTTKYRTSCDFPYQIVEILANAMCPGKLTELDLIALCDVSLQCSVPGHGLYLFLKAIAEGNVKISKPEDIYDFFFSKRTHFLGVEQSTSQALITAASMAMEHLLSYVKIPTLDAEYQQWILYTISAGVELRVLHPYFFLEMARGKRDKDNAVLKYIAKNIGSPQMINSKGNRFQLATDRPICRFEYFEAVKEIESLFEQGVRDCSLKPWCKMSPDGAPVDERCDVVPWTRCNDANLCPYGLLWRHWKLADKEVI